MKNKMKNKKGFTLMEMLIVVAIMVILVAVSVPTFSKQLNNAKTAADQANERAAKAAITTCYLAGEKIGSSEVTTGTQYKYDAATGQLTTGTVTGYGKGGKALDGTTNVPVGGWVVVTINTDTGIVTSGWSGGSSH